MVEYLSNVWPRDAGGWLALADLAVVAVLVYAVLKLIRRTGAVQLAFGAGLLVALYYLSELAPLPTLNWLVSDMLGYIVFAAIVLFQSDIRRGLSSLGRAPLFRYLARPTTTDETIEEIVVAARMLAGRRIGAIIAIERTVGLRNYIESGIPIDSTVTYDLLLSIFQPESPLHDGAVIIQENRIAAAAAFLPLTVSPGAGTRYGARHRAAIGLAEESDAVALIVSEESGAVSLAIAGEVEGPITPEDLRFRLEALMSSSGRRARPGRDRQTLAP